MELPLYLKFLVLTGKSRSAIDMIDDDATASMRPRGTPKSHQIMVSVSRETPNYAVMQTFRNPQDRRICLVKFS